MNLELIFENHDLLVVNKPAGLLSVRGKGEEKTDSVESRCQALFPTAMAVHRLDMATSGILVIAKHKEAERFYKIQFEQRTPKKVYHAVVTGLMPHDTGTMDFPMIVDWERRPIQKICYETGKPALTEYQVLSRSTSNSRVALYPHTGRSHQLRLHLAHLGYPIVGDYWYGSEADKHLPRLLLHAHELNLPQPDGTTLKIVSPTPF